MALMNARRLLKTLQTKNAPKINLSIALGQSGLDSTEILKSISKIDFESGRDLEKYLKDKNVHLISKKKDEDVRVKHNFGKRRSRFDIELDVINTVEDFSLAIVILRVLEKYYLFDIKDIDAAKLHEYDSMELQYVI